MNDHSFIALWQLMASNAKVLIFTNNRKRLSFHKQLTALCAGVIFTKYRRYPKFHSYIDWLAYTFRSFWWPIAMGMRPSSCIVH